MDRPSVENAVKTLLAEFPNMTSKERVKVLDDLFENWCKLCGNAEPCYCAPCYDE